MSSKIKVDTIENVAGSGNVSLGSGHNLVVPGNQTVGGTLGVTGTMAGASTLSLNGVSAQTTYAIQTQTKPIYLSSTDTTYADVTLKKGAATTVDYLQLRDDSNNLDLKIDSVGRFIADRQPNFEAYLGSVQTFSGNADIQFNTISHDVGSNYNTSNYRFTAPVAGRYLFYIHTYTSVSNGAIRALHLKWMKNGSEHRDLTDGGYSPDGGYSYHPAINAAIVMPLSANDYVYVRLAGGGYSGGNVRFDSTKTYWGGYLLG